jgi:MerR family mercuric resistance operon transcriptional regulator
MIGKLAADAGVSVETVRFYQRRGLLPEPERPGPGLGQAGARATADVVAAAGAKLTALDPS